MELFFRLASIFMKLAMYSHIRHLKTCKWRTSQIPLTINKNTIASYTVEVIPLTLLPYFSQSSWNWYVYINGSGSNPLMEALIDSALNFRHINIRYTRITKVSWQWRITLKIAAFLNFVHGPEFKITRVVQWLMLVPSKGSSLVDFSFP
jgi:hypothetical protein